MNKMVDITEHYITMKNKLALRQLLTKWFSNCFGHFFKAHLPQSPQQKSVPTRMERLECFMWCERNWKKWTFQAASCCNVQSVTVLSQCHLEQWRKSLSLPCLGTLLLHFIGTGIKKRHHGPKLATRWDYLWLVLLCWSLFFVLSV